MPSGIRRLVFAIHLTCSVGWIGGVLAYLGLGITTVGAGTPQTVQAAWIAMEIIGWYVLVPLAIGSLLTGLLMALGTKWGLFRYYWVLIAFILTTLATIVLLLHMPDVSAIATAVRTADPDEVNDHGGDLVHAGLALALLLAIQILNLYKPPGVTPYGWRKNNEERLERSRRAQSP